MIATIGTALSLGMAGAKMFSGMKQQRKAEEALAEFKRQSLINPYEHTQVSTLGADRALELAKSAMSSNAYNMAQGGTRGALAGGLDASQKMST